MNESSIDQALVEQALKGDREAFGILVVKHQHRLQRVIMQIVHEPMIAADITQDTFISAYRSLANFKGESSFYTWIYRIAVNNAKNYIKMRDRRPPDTDIDFQDAVEQDNQNLKEVLTPERLSYGEEIQEAVLIAVNKLPEDLRQSIVLRDVAGLSYDEIAKIMHCPVGTVRSRIFRARLAVDQELRPYL